MGIIKFYFLYLHLLKNRFIMDKISLPDNLYASDLRAWARTIRLEHPENKKVLLLCKVILAYIDDTILKDKSNFIGSISLSNEDREIVEKCGWLKSGNIEIRARFTDLMLRFIPGSHKLKKMKSCSDDYFTVSEIVFRSAVPSAHACDYLIRSVRVCVAKQLYDDTFVNRIGKLIVDSDVSPTKTCMIIETFIKNISVELKTQLLKTLNNHFQKRAANDFQFTDKYLDYLWNTGQTNAEDYHLKKALNYESIANRMIADSEPNTFYPQIQDQFQNAYNHIFPYRFKFPDDYSRIKNAFEDANKNSTEMLMICGVPIQYSTNDRLVELIDKVISKATIHNPIDMLHLFIETPLFATSSKYVSQLKMEISDSFFAGAMASTIHYDDKGHIIGKNAMGEYPSIESHKCLRPNSLYYLLRMKRLFKEELITIDERLIDVLLTSKRPEYVNEEDLVFWRIAIISSLEDDYYTASHIIMPQLEKVLRNIAATKVDVVHLENDRQDEHILSELLDDLKPYMNEELNNELRYFLVTGTDVNFRNRLVHGIIRPIEIMKYGPYLMAISLKLFFDKDFLENPI